MEAKKRNLNSGQDRVAFCDDCIAMTSTSDGIQCLKSRKGYKHHSRLQLTACARTGCPFCFWMWIELRHKWPIGSSGRLCMSARQLTTANQIETSTDTITNIEDTSNFTDGSLNRPIALSSITGIIVGGKEKHHVTFSASDPLYFATQAELEEFYISNQVTATNMAGDATIKQARRYLDECCRIHKSCPACNTPVLPARVIAIDTDNGNISSTLYISKEGERAEYVALSYCWGGKQIYATTSSTLESMCRGLAHRKLPQTIQDAISVTAKLGIRYLWVDALCIIQDNTADRTREISLMGSIYKNAILTIAASNAASASEGFLTTIPTSRSFYVRYVSPSGTSQCLVKSVSISSGHSPIEPLDRRAWALQESLLSPRVLVFSERELLWRCQTDLLQTSLARAKTCKRLPSSIFGIPEKVYMDTELLRIHNWRNIVEDYSGRNLTLPQDRLVALSGIASELSAVWGDRYHAGLWESCLLNHLTWRRIGSLETNKFAKPYEAPSWSWASIVNGVLMPPLGRIDAKLISCTTEPRYPNAPYGQFSSGQLVLSGLTVDQMPSWSSSWIQKYWDSSKENEKHCIFLIVGMDLGKRYVGLILYPVRKGKFKRCGLWTLDLEFKTTWKPNLESEQDLTFVDKTCKTFTII